MEQARSCCLERWKFGYIQKQYPQIFLDPPQEVFLIVTTTKELG